MCLLSLTKEIGSDHRKSNLSRVSGTEARMWWTGDSGCEVWK